MERKKTQVTAWLERVASIAAPLFAATGAGLVAVAVSTAFFDRADRNGKQADLAGRIEELTRSLNSAARSVSEIEREIHARQQLVARLREDAETAKNLATINEQQAQAIAQALRGQLQQQEREAYWWSVGQNAFFTLLGVVLAELYHWVRRRRGKNTDAS
jgi:TolA-binding protein